MLWLPKDKEVGVGLRGPLATETDMPWLGPFAYVATIMHLPGPTALTSPVALTVATAGLDEEKDKYFDSVTFTTLPSGNVPDILRYSKSPGA
jgi:hypothetical protein